MRKSIIIAGLFGILALPAAYIALPFWTAWSIREAIKSGDSAYLAEKIDFAGLRETLGPSLVQYAFDMPDPSAAEAAPKPGLWKRVKVYWGSAAVNRMVDQYLTPEGLPELFQLRQNYRDVTGTAANPAQKPPFAQRFKAFWSRLVRAEFKTASAFEIEIRDQYDLARHHVGLLERRGFGWTLTALRVKQVGFEAVSEDARFDPASARTE